jgi:hypothetical protein
MINIADIVEECNSYREELWAPLLGRLVAEKALFHKQTYTLPVSRFLATLHLQSKTTSAAGIQKWGFSELQRRLSALPKDSSLRLEELDGKEYAVRCVFDSNSSTLLGCTIVLKRQETRQTPPAWDGSLDALEKFNNSPKE